MHTGSEKEYLSGEGRWIFYLCKKLFHFIHIVLFQPGILNKKKITGLLLLFLFALLLTKTLAVSWLTIPHHGQKIIHSITEDFGVFYRRADTALKRSCPEWKGRKALAGGAQVVEALVFSWTASAHASVVFLVNMRRNWGELGLGHWCRQLNFTHHHGLL